MSPRNPPPLPPERQRQWAPIVPLPAIVLVLLIVGGTIFLAQTVKVRERSHDGVSIDLPGGRVDIRTHDRMDPATLGVPVYPGAKLTHHGGGATFSWTSGDTGSETNLAVQGAELYTPDRTDKVLLFYRGQLPNWIVIEDDDGRTHLELRQGGLRRIIALRPEGSGTHIGVATAGEPASN